VCVGFWMKVEVFHSGFFTSPAVVSTIQFGGRGIGFEGVVSRRVGLLGVNCRGFHSGEDKGAERKGQEWQETMSQVLRQFCDTVC
jgi:hypothetical protein